MLSRSTSIAWHKSSWRQGLEHHQRNRCQAGQQRHRHWQHSFLPLSCNILGFLVLKVPGKKDTAIELSEHFATARELLTSLVLLAKVDSKNSAFQDSIPEEEIAVVKKYVLSAPLGNCWVCHCLQVPGQLQRAGLESQDGQLQKVYVCKPPLFECIFVEVHRLEFVFIKGLILGLNEFGHRVNEDRTCIASKSLVEIAQTSVR